MKEAIRLIRKEILALKFVASRLSDLKAAVTKVSDAVLTREESKKFEAALAELSAVSSEKEKFLQTNKKQDMEAYVKAQEDSNEREVAMRLLTQLKESERKLASESYVTKELLKRSSEFVDFRINVMAAAKADTTYGPPGKNASPVANKMFDANV
ncbi:MAG: hypothetical protein J6O04_07020 [Selenomonadaceae bacterium]|nr:hypothetical protein [Selenomonadaceae bacterium]